MTDLAAYIQETPLIDSHEHLRTEQEYVENGPDVLADLFECLYEAARDGYQAGHPRAGFKTANELADLLTGKAGRKVTPRAVAVRMSRLRQLFEKTRNNRFLIQTHRTKGYRFSLRRGSQTIKVHDPM